MECRERFRLPASLKLLRDEMAPWRTRMGRAQFPHRAGQRTGWLCLVIALAAKPVPTTPREREEPDQRAADALLRFLDRTPAAHQYTASRRLEASGSGHRGWLDADTEFSAASGLVYRVTAEGGSGYIRSRVLRSLLDEEQRV